MASIAMFLSGTRPGDRRDSLASRGFLEIDRARAQVPCFQMEEPLVVLLGEVVSDSGAPKTNRTSDLPLRRGLLYPLSYRGAAAKLSHAGPGSSSNPTVSGRLYVGPNPGAFNSVSSRRNRDGKRPALVGPRLIGPIGSHYDYFGAADRRTIGAASGDDFAFDSCVLRVRRCADRIDGPLGLTGVIDGAARLPRLPVARENGPPFAAWFALILPLDLLTLSLIAGRVRGKLPCDARH